MAWIYRWRVRAALFVLLAVIALARPGFRSIGAGLIICAQPQIVGALHFTDRQYRQVGNRAGLECEMRYPVFRIRGQGANNIDDVCDHR